MTQAADVNANYLYDYGDINQLTKLYKAEEENPNLIWGEPLGFSESSGELIAGRNDLRDACKDLKPGQKLLLPLNLKKSFHWVGVVIERTDNGFIINTMDSLPPHKHAIDAAVVAIKAAMGTQHNISVISKDYDEATLKQPDGTSCGTYTIQNLINHADPAKAEDIERTALRKKHMKLAGKNFSIKQAKNIDVTRDMPPEHLEIVLKQSEEIDAIARVIEKKAQELPQRFEPPRAISPKSQAPAEEKLSPKSIAITVQPSLKRLPSIDDNFEKALDYTLSIEEPLTKRMLVELMLQKFPEQKELLTDLKGNLSDAQSVNYSSEGITSPITPTIQKPRQRTV